MPYCKVCALKSDHPGISLDGEEVCNLCNLDVDDELLANVNYTSEVYREFENSGPNPHAPYDCLLMYSGGKDSTYVLDKFVNEHRKRVLAYTFDVPFESVHAAENVRLARDRIPATFVLDRDDDNIKKMMREVFNRPAPKKPGKYLDEKLPCVSCRTFFVLRAILYAREHRIPYVVLCADPQQIITMESNVREVAKGFYKTFGRELTTELFGDAVEQLLFAEDDELPKIVFPFVAMRHGYDPDRIVEELKTKGLYNSSPLETHCTLFPLLNYYSFKHWDCMFYKLNASSFLRAVEKHRDFDRSTFSIKFPRDADVLEIEARLKTILFEIAADEGDPESQEAALVDLFKQLDATDDAARFVARSFLDMRQVASDMGIRLD